MRQCPSVVLIQLARICSFVGVVVALAAVARAEPAIEQGEQPKSPAVSERESPLPFRLGAHGVLTWEAELGAGLRADIAVFGKSRLYNGRDELAISVGGDISFVSFGSSENRITVWPTVNVQWSLAVNDHFVFYPELGLVAKIQPGDWDGLYPNVGFGGRYFLYRSLALHGRLGWPMAVSLGLTF